MKPTREELAQAVDEVTWDALRAHLERGGLIVVARELDLVDTGVKVAADEAPAIAAWIREGKLSKPTTEQIELWAADRATSFRCLIVSPYVLIQEKPDTLQ